MSAQLLTIMLTVFVLGLFVGSNLSVILMCLLQAASKNQPGDVDVMAVTIQVEE